MCLREGQRLAVQGADEGGDDPIHKSLVGAGEQQAITA